MKFTLLTHSKELGKPSNTGKLVVEILGSAAEQLLWDRLVPPAKLVEEIEAGGVALLYPGTADEEAGDLAGIHHIILIDSTWHEARRIHQRSPYLQNVRRISLKPAEKSRYNLRKNQKESGLCTAECVMEILRATGNSINAERLQERFLSHIKPAGRVRGIKKQSPESTIAISGVVNELLRER
ncbi:MAG: DTW domain-containing protein [Deltaproteobacteria bacterium HGW-Deltaproteobacteria-23]|jgi:DTW domain-containing protein YfiP|nr:MAG: DTW domain-containing protein [Deltaproteobacteria bacterium HGW-Deltaproteobacteria-23]